MAQQSDKEAGAMEESQYRVEDYYSDGKLFGDIEFFFKRKRQENDEALEHLETIFLENLLAVFLTASALPVFAHRTAYNTGYMTMFGITMVSKGMDDSGKAGIDIKSPDYKTQLIEKSHIKMKETIEETKWGKVLDEMTEATARQYLNNFIQSESGRDAVRHIMNQCSVSVWSAFEILASDVFVSLLNRKPNLAAALLNTEITKKYYREKELAASLVEYNYDLSRHMGEALIQQRRLDDLLAIKNIYGVLMEKFEGLRDLLNEAGLWKLYKTRNLIVHRAGVVDLLFQKETGDTSPLGTKLRVTPSELKAFMVLIGRVASELVDAATSIIRDRPESKAVSTV